MASYKQRTIDPHFLVNLDETAVYLNRFPTRTVHAKGKKTVSVMIGGALSIRFTLAVSVAMDSTKLALFATFKGISGGIVDKQLSEIIPAEILGCVQKK